MVDDTLTSGESLLRATAQVAQTGARITGLYTLLDREEGGRERIEEAGYRLRSIFRRSDLLTPEGRALAVLE